jgi:phosphoglycolate phosphatase
MREAHPARSGPLFVWGFDGTVVDSYDAIRHAVDSSLDAHGLRPPGSPWAVESVLRPLVGLSLDRIFFRLVHHIEPDWKLVDSLVAAYRSAFRSVAPRQVTVRDGLVDVLTGLEGHGVASIVASSDGPGTVLLLDRLGLAEHFTGVVSDEHVARPYRKPDPGLVRWACAQHGYGPDQCVVIGDSVFDVEMGHAAGTDTVWVAWGNHTYGDVAESRPTHRVDDVDQLGALLHRYAGSGDPCGTSTARAPAGHASTVKIRRHRITTPSRCTPR